MPEMVRAMRGGDRPVTAFVMSGGGNQGVGQVGMLRALLERGHQPDVIIGTSVGALNGSRIATAPDLDSVDRLEHARENLESVRNPGYLAALTGSIGAQPLQTLTHPS